MRVRVFETLTEAAAERARIDAAAGFPRQLREGEYAIFSPGRAAARIRGRGVRTEHAAAIVQNYDGTRWAVCVGEGAEGATELNVGAWRGAGRVPSREGAPHG